MSKYIINHVCGHQSVTNICGKVSERDSRAEWLGTFLCPECQAQARAEKSAADAAAAAAAGLPALTGSPKQIAWAESLRRTALAAAAKKLAIARQTTARQIRAARAAYRSGAMSVRPTLAAAEQFIATGSPAAAAKKKLEALRVETRASWFIDNRDR